MEENTILLFTLGRSGGSTLQHSIQAGIGKKILSEPLNGGKWCEEVSSCLTFEEKRSKLFEILDGFHEDGCVGIKVNSTTFYDISLRVETINNLFDYYDRVVLNYRHNILRTEISGRIANKTDKWHESLTEEEVQEYSWEEDLYDIEEDVRKQRFEWNEYLKYIENNNVSNYTMNYRRLYGIEDVDYRVNEVRKLIEWLGYEFDIRNIASIRSKLSPKRKVSSKRTYKVIENIDEINKRLGPEFGYLY